MMLTRRTWLANSGAALLLGGGLGGLAGHSHAQPAPRAAAAQRAPWSSANRCP